MSEVKRVKSDLGFVPHGNRVLVQPVVPEPKVGGIMLPENARETRPAEAVVVALGGRVAASFEARVGDRVIVDRYAGTNVQIGGRDYKLHAPEEVLAVVEEE